MEALMTRAHVIFALLALSLLFPSGQAIAQQDLIPPCDSPDQPVTADISEDYYGPIEGYTEGWTVTEGLFKYYTDPVTNRVLVSINQNQLDHKFLISETLNQGTGSGIFVAPMMFGHDIFEFRRDGDYIEAVWPNYQITTNMDEPMGRAVEMGISDEIFGRIPVDMEDTDTGYMVIDLATLLLSASQIEMLGMYVGTQFLLDYEGSRVSEIKGFPLNDEIDTRLLLYGATDVFGNYPLGAQELNLHFSISEPPPPGYIPRLSDDRVGYFVDLQYNYCVETDSAETRYVRYVNRWRLEKTDPEAEISDPVEPIVFWLENTVPYEYRDAIRDGVLFWTSAFEAAGFSNAIQVRQMPDDADWDPADIRYNTIRWFVSPSETYAIGPSRTDPRTGEIYDADIGVNADMMRGPFNELTTTIRPLADAYAPCLPPGWPDLDFHQIRQDPVTTGLSGSNLPFESFLPGYDPYSQARSFEVGRSFDILHMSNRMEPGSPEEEEFLNDYLVSLIAHEVGHCLGLRHNFAGSAATSYWKLNQRNWTLQHGLSSSIMDYTTTNISPNGELQGQYFQTTPGDYDVWAIQYGYTPINAETSEDELEILDEIASRSPEFRYGTDEDASGFSRNLDPDLYLWDLGDDPVHFYRSRLTQSRQLLDGMLEYWSEPGTRPTRIRRAFTWAFWDYVLAANGVPRIIGGVRSYRDHIGDPGAHPAFVPASAEEQRRALEFIEDHIWAEGAFDIDPDILNMLPTDRQRTIDYSYTASGNLDFDVHEWVLYAQSAPFYWIYDPMVLTRVLNNEVRMPDGEEIFTLVELFDTVRSAIWSELESGISIDSYRRNLQRAHLEMITGIILEPAPGTPEDAVSLARRDLIALRDLITGLNAPHSGMDEMTCAHLDECLSRINLTLEAPMSRGGGFPGFLIY